MSCPIGQASECGTGRQNTAASTDGWRTLTQPCPSCPWRLDQGAQDIPEFSLAKAQELVATCPNERGHGPDFGAALFACHQSKSGSEIPCAGWLAAVGHAHPHVRLAVLHGRLAPGALETGPGWPPLHDNYGQVLRKLEAGCVDIADSGPDRYIKRG
ncbi:DUF6283 family protein [Acidovorax sp. LjRoot118]|uniref:DUF6283 family protein n=1 Tax=Acidovorax sp. LjRoot118 TaxID=3342256 RepID=UPI003F4FDBE0